MTTMHRIASLLIAAMAATASCTPQDHAWPGRDDDGAVSPRDLYEVHLSMTAEEIKGLLDECLLDLPHPLLPVRAISQPGSGSVDVRVEFGQQMPEKWAACVDAYLAAHGAKEFETDTMFWPPPEPGGSSTSTGG